MTLERSLATLAVLAIALLLVALAMSGVGMRLPALTLPTDLGLSQIRLPVQVVRSLPDPGVLALGVVIGWLLRWLYALPWLAIPRAIAAWLLSWRTGVASITLAVCCMAILLFY